MKAAIIWADKHLNNLIDNYKLEPDEIHLLLQMQQDLLFLMKQLELYIQELQNIAAGNPSPW